MTQNPKTDTKEIRGKLGAGHTCSVNLIKGFVLKISLVAIARLA
jgi:hypothetical protein